MTGSLDFQKAASAFDQRMSRSPLIRAVNFHNTSRARRREYRDQLQQLSRAFSPVSEQDLDRYLATGEWRKSKPGVIIAVYEGYRNGYDVLRPLLEEFGLIGWFFIITGFVTSPVLDQLAYANSHEIDMLTQEYPDGRYALSWSEIRELDQRHVVACHAHSHVLLSSLTPAARELEVIGSQNEFEKQLGHPVRSFVSYGGPPYGEDAMTDGLIDRAGYRFVFSNYRIQRIR